MHGELKYAEMEWQSTGDSWVSPRVTGPSTENYWMVKSPGMVTKLWYLGPCVLIDLYMASYESRVRQADRWCIS